MIKKTLKDFTHEIKDKIPQYQKKCLKDLSSGKEFENFDIQKANEYIEYVYNLANEKKPIIIYANNPVEYRYYFELLQKSDKLLKYIHILFLLKNKSVLNENKILDDSLHDSLDESFYNSLDESLDASLRSSLNASLDNSLDNSLDASLRNSLRNSLDNSLRSSLNASLNDSLNVSLRDSLRNSLDASLRASLDVLLSTSLRASLHNSLSASLHDSLSDSLRESLDDSLHNLLNIPLNKSLSDSLRNSLDASLRASLRSSLNASLDDSLSDSLHDSLNTSLCSSLDDSLYTSLDDSFIDLLDDSFDEYKIRSLWLWGCGVYARVYLTWYKFIKDEFNITTNKEKELDFLYKNSFNGIGRCWFTKLYVLVLKVPKKIRWNNTLLHSISGPALEWNNYNLYYINGRKMPEWIFKGFTKEQFFKEENEEIRAGMYEILLSKGDDYLLDFLELQKKDFESILYKNGETEEIELYHTQTAVKGASNLAGDIDVKLAFIKFICPSTKQKFMIPTWPDFKTALEAAKYSRPERVNFDINYMWDSRN